MTLLRITWPEKMGLQRVETVEVRKEKGNLARFVEEMAEKIEVIDANGDVQRVLKDRHGPTG